MDAADIAVAAEVKASGQAGIPHEQVMAALDALDAADQADSAAQAAVILVSDRRGEALRTDLAAGRGRGTDPPP